VLQRRIFMMALVGKREYNAAAEAGCSIKRHDPPVNVVGGRRFPDAPVIDLAPITRSPPPPANDTAVSHNDSLDIPEFLRRTSPMQMQEAA
jgi:hypothetical protein